MAADPLQSDLHIGSILGALVLPDYFVAADAPEEAALTFPSAGAYTEVEDKLRASVAIEQDLRERWIVLLQDWRRQGPSVALKLARRGVPASLRGLVWICAIGNTSRVGAALYGACLARAVDVFGPVAVCGGCDSPPGFSDVPSLRQPSGRDHSQDDANNDAGRRGLVVSGPFSPLRDMSALSGSSSPVVIALDAASEMPGCSARCSPMLGSTSSSVDSGRAAPLTRARSTVGLESSFLAVSADLSRTFPDLSFFYEGSEARGQLARVLAALAVYRPDIGYVQGFSHLAAMLIMSVCAALPPVSSASPSPLRSVGERRESVADCSELLGRGSEAANGGGTEGAASTTVHESSSSLGTEPLSTTGMRSPLNTDNIASSEGDYSLQHATTAAEPSVPDADFLRLHREASKNDLISAAAVTSMSAAAPPIAFLSDLEPIRALPTQMALNALPSSHAAGSAAEPERAGSYLWEPAASSARPSGLLGGLFDSVVRPLHLKGSSESAAVDPSRGGDFSSRSALPFAYSPKSREATSPVSPLLARQKTVTPDASGRIDSLLARLLPGWRHASVSRAGRDAGATALGGGSGEEETVVFSCLSNLILGLPPVRWYASRDSVALGAWARLVDACLAAAAPAAAACLESQGVTADLFLPSWVLTLFARPLGVDAAAGLWDRCVLGGSVEVLRCVVGLVAHLEPLLADAGSFEGCLAVLARVPACARGPLSVAAAVDATRIPIEAAELLDELEAAGALL